MLACVHYRKSAVVASSIALNAKLSVCTPSTQYTIYYCNIQGKLKAVKVLVQTLKKIYFKNTNIRC